MATQAVCKFNKFGFCKFNNMCRNEHVKELCENSSCKVQICRLRHPKKCKFYSNFGRCKFGEWCSYEHTEKVNMFGILKQGIENLSKQIENIEKDLKEKDEIIDNLVDKMRKCEEYCDNSKNEGHGDFRIHSGKYRSLADGWLDYS